jgi:hypothetical protein
MTPRDNLALTGLWGFYFYVIFCIQLISLYLVDFNLIGVEDKWRFTSPTIASVTFLLLSVVGFLTLYVTKYSLKKKKILNAALFIRSSYYYPSLFIKLFYAALVVTFVYLNFFVFTENYRLQAGATPKLFMGISNSLLVSLTLILILINRVGENKNVVLIFLGLLGLGAGLTGVGTFVVLLALLFLWGSSPGTIRFKSYVKTIVAGVVVVGITLVFILTWKYGFDFMSIRVDDVLVLIGWVIQRLSTVTASSVFLIENFYFHSPGFGFDGAYQVMVSNIGKIFGQEVSSFQFASLGQYNFSLFYTGSNDDIAGASPGLIGGSLFFFPWYLAAFISGIILFGILSMIAASWGRYLGSNNWVTNLIFFYFFIHFFLLNPYAWISIFDPGFARFIVFVLAPFMFSFFSRFRWVKSARSFI